MIRIAHVIDTIESPTAGTEKQLLLTIRHLDPDKFSQFLCCCQASEWLNRNFKDCPLFVTGRFSRKYFFFPYHIGRLAQFLTKHSVDIVHTYFRDSNVIGIIAAKLARVKVIVSSRRGLPYWNNKSELMLLRRLNNSVNVFVANSESTKAWVHKIEKVPENKIEVIYNGLDFQSMTREAGLSGEEVRDALEIPRSDFVVGIVANLRRVKGIDDFLRAGKIVSQEFPDTRFLIVGDGDERKSLERLSNDLGIASKVYFLGRRSDVYQILKAVDIGVLSSHYESFSNAILEYMGAGLAVVCTDVGGAREVIENGINGQVVSSGDPIALAEAVKQILHERRYPHMKLANKLKVKELFSASKMIACLERLYSNQIHNLAGTRGRWLRH